MYLIICKAVDMAPQPGGYKKISNVKPKKSDSLPMLCGQ